MGMWYEDFDEGQVFRTASRLVERELIAQFAELTGDDNPIHTDSEFMRASAYGDVIAHGMLVQSLAAGLIADLGIMQGTTIALAGVDSRFIRPVFPGDEISVVMSIASKRQSRKPDRGVVVRHAKVINQRAEVVAETQLITVMKRRAPIRADDRPK